MTQITMLNSMAAADLPAQLDRHAAWGLTQLDLKDGIFGKRLLDLTIDEARTARKLIDERGLAVHCFSTGLMYVPVENGPAEFQRDLGNLDHILRLAEILRPHFIRLLAAKMTQRATISDSAEYIKEKHSWLPGIYREAVGRIHAAGFKATIENEVGGNIFSNANEVVGFFELLDCANKVCFTWDAANMWEEGTCPALAVYEKLKPLIGYYHIKGGRHNPGAARPSWRTSLQDATWPIREITQRIAADKVSPVICLNPSHGKPLPDYDYANIVERDLKFLQSILSEVQ
jgi:sugar phosphate isomerase/epimerase